MRFDLQDLTGIDIADLKRVVALGGGSFGFGDQGDRHRGVSAFGAAADDS